MDQFAKDAKITVQKNCPVKKNGKTIGKVVGVRQTDGEIIVDFNLGDQDILGMYSVSIGEVNHEAGRVVTASREFLEMVRVSLELQKKLRSN